MEKGPDGSRRVGRRAKKGTGAGPLEQPPDNPHKRFVSDWESRNGKGPR